MGDIFSSAPGTVAVMQQDYVLPGKIKIADHEPQGFLVGGADYDQSTEQQFQPSLDRAVYIYCFGDRMGSIVVSGKAFLAFCGQGGGGDAVGFKELLELYAQNRASVKPEPVDISIGSQVISGFMTAIKIRSTTLAEDPVGLCYDFWITVNALPGK